MSYQNIPNELKKLKDKDLISKIKDRFNYNPFIGKLFYKPRWIKENDSPRHKQWNTRFAHKEVIGFINRGYVRVNFDDQRLYLHQIAFAIMKGFIPEEIDHKDRNKSNNVWNNLREIDHNSNMFNIFQRKTNKTKLKGVSWSKWSNCWRMDICFKGKKYHSFHSTKEAAYQAYCDTSVKLHGEFGCVE